MTPELNISNPPIQVRRSNLSITSMEAERPINQEVLALIANHTKQNNQVNHAMIELNHALLRNSIAFGQRLEELMGATHQQHTQVAAAALPSPNDDRKVDMHHVSVPSASQAQPQSIPQPQEEPRGQARARQVIQVTLDGQHYTFVEHSDKHPSLFSLRQFVGDQFHIDKFSLVHSDNYIHRELMFKSLCSDFFGNRLEVNVVKHQPKALPLHRFKPADLVQKLQDWLLNDIDFKKNLLKIQSVFGREGLGGD